MPEPLRGKSIRGKVSALGRVQDSRHNRVEQLMTKTRISAMVQLGVMYETRKLTGSNAGLLLVTLPAGGAAIRSAVLVLLAVSSLSVSAATTDPVDSPHIGTYPPRGLGLHSHLESHWL
jgi:hypothetical protein